MNTWTKQNFYGNKVNIYHPALYGVIVDLKYQANIWSAKSTHGSSFDYDRKVAMVLMGKDIRPGIVNKIVYTRDIAPTLAKKNKLKVPKNIDGNVLKLKD